jgi:N-acetylglucosamine kinase-like BadF-type ATPase
VSAVNSARRLIQKSFRFLGLKTQRYRLICLFLAAQGRSEEQTRLTFAGADEFTNIS